MFKELKEKYDELESSSQASDDNLDYIEDRFFDRIIFFDDHDAEEIMDRFQL